MGIAEFIIGPAKGRTRGLRHPAGLHQDPAARAEIQERFYWQAEATKMIRVHGAPIDDSDAGKIVDCLRATC